MKKVTFLLVIFGLFSIGCEPPPEDVLPPCGAGTHEEDGICVTDETEPPCGKGTHEEGGICVPDKPACIPNTEICDDIDNDCDGDVDEGCVRCYPDGDGDGYISSFALMFLVLEFTTCPKGYLQHGLGDKTDCDDGDKEINPGATEICDGLDNDCDGQVDEGCSAQEQEAQFVKASVVVSSTNTSTIIASYELTTPARIYYKFRYSLNEAWWIGAFTNQKNKKGSCGFGPISPKTNVYWRLEARNDDDKIVDTFEGGLSTP